MSEIGRWGSALVFSVNSQKQLPFRDFSKKLKARWATHDIYADAPRTEYLGIDQGEVKLEVAFSAHHGQNPYKSLTLLEDALSEGTLEYLYIGGKRIGKGKHYIESIDSDWDEVWNRGELMRATVQITFKEAR